MEAPMRPSPRNKIVRKDAAPGKSARASQTKTGSEKRNGAPSAASRPARPARRTRTVALDHISMSVRDLKAARAFYEAALGAIGMKVNLDVSSALGMGSRNEKIFWLARDRKASGGGHYAFRVDHREEVDAFHAAGLAAGGQDNGAPGPRPDYGPTYYAAFVKDGEGNNIEVVCYARVGASRSGRARG
jgi:catechol 2,3-dioxygenase-like lactoylglutathione lyase family enzyme